MAVTKTGTSDIQTAIDWLVSHEDEPDTSQRGADQPQGEPQEVEKTEENPAIEGEIAKSIKCDDCGKLFKSQDEVEFHATKSGHENFSESTEEKKPLTEEEKKDQLAKIEAKLRQRRLDREAREKQEALEKERIRIKSGKEMLEAKKKHDELEMKKIIEQRKREKEDERLAKQRVKEQIEQDRLARKAKFSGQSFETPPSQQQPQKLQTPKPQTSYSEVILQIRLADGASIVQKFGAKEPLSAVRLFVQMNCPDGNQSFSLMTNYPKKVFGPDDYDAPLETLGLAPRATLFVSKN